MGGREGAWVGGWANASGVTRKLVWVCAMIDRLTHLLKKAWQAANNDKATRHPKCIR